MAIDYQVALEILRALLDDARRVIKKYTSLKDEFTDQLSRIEETVAGADQDAARAETALAGVRELLSRLGIEHQWQGTYLRLRGPDDWGPFINLIGETGPQGEQGPRGERGERGAQGASTHIRGSLDNPTLLPIGGEPGDLYLMDGTGYGYAAGDGYAWDETRWVNVGKIRGPVGKQGPRGDQGLQGLRGLTGDQGAKGEKGDQGIPGIKGDKGDIGLTGERGPQGERGPKGDQGVAGTDGLDGADGAPGEKGEKGDRGDTGPKGDQGLQGIQGQKGDKGDIGLTGAKGDQGIQGVPGTNGTNGVDGAKGDKGDQGIQGERGLQGYDGPKGDKGDIGLTGPKGDKGDIGLTGAKGDQGIQGIPGQDGVTGPKGDKGDMGLQGIPGIKGDQGIQGVKGDQGPKGDQGIQGIQGLKGDTGTLSDADRAMVNGKANTDLSNADFLAARRSLGLREINAADPRFGGGMVADCTDIGTGTDNGPRLQLAVNAWIAAGSGAALHIPSGRYRIASPVDIDLGGRIGMVFDASEAVLTTDKIPMRVLDFHNAQQLTIKARFVEGGPFAGWGSSKPYPVDYGSVAEVVEAGGQEAIRVSGVSGYTVDLTGENYAGRLLRVSRARTGEPTTGGIKGVIRTSRGVNLSKPRTAQSLFTDNGNSGFTGFWGHLDGLHNDFDSWAPVWRDVNDVAITYLDGAYGLSGPSLEGVGVFKGGIIYVGDIDGNPSNSHLSIVPSPATGRLSSAISIDQLTMLNVGNGLRLIDPDPSARALDARMIMMVGAPSIAFSTVVALQNARGVNIGSIVGDGAGDSLLYVSGANSDDIRVGLHGKGLTGNFALIAPEVTGQVEISGRMSDPVPGRSVIVVSGDTPVRLTSLDVSASNGASLIYLTSATNQVRWVSGSKSGSSPLYAGYPPAYVEPGVSRGQKGGLDPEIVEITRSGGDPKILFHGDTSDTWNRISGNGPIAILPKGSDETSQPMIWADNSRVGINKSGPLRTLDVNGDFEARRVYAMTTTGSLTDGYDKGNIQVQSAGPGHDAVMSFLINGQHGINFGLGQDNQMRVGGWSWGGSSYRILTEQNAPTRWSGIDPYYILQSFPNGAQLQIGTAVLGLDEIGNGFLPFAVAFNNTCHVVIVSNGDFNNHNAGVVQTIDTNSNTGCWVNAPNRTRNDYIRINYVAFGW
ncbi:collagen-like protein [Methylobacterium indicum]|uniref:Tail fiber protein n=1 Tax=Methylobacterium indicum TaxID=1775910 RepID=A0A8H8X0E7_9HYPH|nr:collagen-like protein [Methylobacterium indicum]BCM87749.1 hypothetical protein mvi_62100 [Methylobacterium indicum]